MSTSADTGARAAVVAKTAPKKRVKSRAEAALDRFHEETSLTQTYDLKNLARLWPYVRPQLPAILASMGMLVVSAGFAMTRPLLMRAGLDTLSHPDAGDKLARTAAMLAGVIFLEQSLAFPQMYLMQLAGARAMSNLRGAVFGFLHTRRLGFFDKTPVGRLVTRVTNDVDAINEMFASGALNAVGDLIRLVAIVIIMLSLDWKMSLLAFVAMPPVALGVNWTRSRIRDAFRAVRTKTARMNAYLNEQISGMAVVQAYAREERSAEEFDEINAGYRDANNQSIILDAALDAAIEMVSSVCIASVLWWAGVKSVSDKISFGTVFAFVNYIEMFFLPIRDLSARFTLLQSAMAGAERVFELFDNKEEDAPEEPSSSDQGSSMEPPPSGGGHLAEAFALDDVTFSYKAGTPVLREVSISAKPGEKIALVGATGAGKSTVASILLRLYEVQSGEVRVGGRPVRSYGRSALRTQFAVVPQDVFLFPGTVATNIAAGDVVPDRKRVVAALELIGALDLFERREGGLDGKVAERGSNFSAGERQLIAFARALYKDPPILILDEATANVDSDTEAQLQRALSAAMVGRSALIIAHRLSTIRAVDRIIVFHKGRVVEQGTHDELLAKDGVYAKLYKLQYEKERVLKAKA